MTALRGPVLAEEYPGFQRGSPVVSVTSEVLANVSFQIAPPRSARSDSDQASGNDNFAALVDSNAAAGNADNRSQDASTAPTPAPRRADDSQATSDNRSRDNAAASGQAASDKAASDKAASNDSSDRDTAASAIAATPSLATTASLTGTAAAPAATGTDPAAIDTAAATTTANPAKANGAKADPQPTVSEAVTAQIASTDATVTTGIALAAS